MHKGHIIVTREDTVGDDDAGLSLNFFFCILVECIFRRAAVWG